MENVQLSGIHYPLLRVRLRKHGNHPTLAELLSSKKEWNKKGGYHSEVENAKN